MTDDEVKSKKHSSRRMFGWLFVDAQVGFIALFSLLLIGAIIIQAPWKVTVLWGIILSFTIVLSRAHRNWMWFVLAIVSIGLVAWMAVPFHDDGKWSQYTFEEELAELQSQRAVPEEQNAAGIYTEIFESCDYEYFDGIFRRYDPKAETLYTAWDGLQYPFLANWMDVNRDTIGRLIETADMKYCRFDIPTTPLQVNRQLWRLSLIKRWSFILVRSANYDIGNNMSKEAVDKLLAVLKMADHHYQQGNLLDMPSALVVELAALDAVNNIVIKHEVGNEQLEEIEERLAGSGRDWFRDWEMVLAERKLFVKNVAGMFYEANDAGEVRLNRNVFKTLNRQLETRIPVHRFRGRLARLGVVVQWFMIPSRPEIAAEMIDRDFDKYVEDISSGEDIARAAEEMFISFEKIRNGRLVFLRLNCAALVDLAARQNASYYYPLYSQYLRSVSTKRACRLIIALKRYYTAERQWPESLNEIRSSVSPEIMIDAVNGGEFVYKPVEDGFVLYSKGPNGIDDGGLRKTREGKDDLRIWPVNRDYDSLWMLEPEKEDEQPAGDVI